MINLLKFLWTHPMSRRRRLSAMSRFLRWQLVSRIISAPVLVKWINDTSFILSRGESGISGNYYVGLHEQDEMAFLLKTIARDEVFVDVGANVGSYTLIASGVKGAKGIVFEPVPETYLRLMRNLRLNDLTTRVKAYNRGVSSMGGKLRFITNMNCENHVVDVDVENTLEFLEIEVVKLDDIFSAGPSPHVMKIDVEGHEENVLEGAHSVLANRDLNIVIMEVNFLFGCMKKHECAAVRIMLDNGFSPHTYSMREKELHLLQADETWPSNIIFIRDVDAVRLRLQKAFCCHINGEEFSL